MLIIELSFDINWGTEWQYCKKQSMYQVSPSATGQRILQNKSLSSSKLVKEICGRSQNNVSYCLVCQWESII